MTSARLSKKELYELNKYDRMLSFYRDDPIEFLRDVLKINPAWFQRIQLREMWNKPFVLMSWGRGTSKTSINAYFSCAKAMLYPGIAIGSIAPTYRQAQYLFDEIERTVWPRSPFLRQSCQRGIIRGSASTTLKFKNGSYIEALPPGADKGNKIRGRRYNIIIIDEFASIDDETVNLVILPMMAIRAGIRHNQLIISSSAFIKENHFYDYFKRYKQLMKEKPDKYYVSRYNFVDVKIADHKEFQVDMDSVVNAFHSPTTTISKFLMEWAGVFPDSDEDAFYPEQLISECTPRGMNDPIEPEIYGDKNAQYVMGIDTARDPQGDDFSIVILKAMPHRIRHIVKVIGHKGITFQQQRDIIRQQMHVFRFDMKGIYLGLGGGGATLKDLLAEPWEHNGVKYSPIVDIDDEENYTPTQWREGQKILHIIKETAPLKEIMHTINKSEMEQHRLLFPVTMHKDINPQFDETYKQIEILKNEMIALRTEMTAGSTIVRFVVPRGKHDDRLTALLFANYGLYDLTKHEDEHAGKLVMPVGFWANIH